MPLACLGIDRARTAASRFAGHTRDFHLGPKPPSIELPQNCSHPDLRGLVGTLFGSIFGENWSGVAVLKKIAIFFTVEVADFDQIWTSEGPNVVKIPNTRVSDPFPVTFPGGKFWYHDKKKLAHFWARREARFAICPFFLRKIFFRPGLFFGRLERPKRPPNAPGLASVPAAVLWQHYFHRRPLTVPLAQRSREARVHWCGSVHTAPRPAGGRVLCQGVLPGPI